MQDLFSALAKFSGVNFYRPKHKCTWDGMYLTSQSALVKKYKPDEDFDQIAKDVAARRGVDPDALRAEWTLEGDISRVKGTLFHTYMENSLRNYTDVEPTDSIAETFKDDMKTAMRVINEYNKVTKMVDRFMEDTAGKLHPVASEMIISSKKYKAFAIADQIYVHIPSGSLQIADWKTNKKIGTSNDYGTKLKGPLDHLDSCELVYNSLQLHIEKILFEDTAEYPVDRLWMSHFHDSNDKYVVYNALDLSAEAQLILDIHAGIRKA